MARSPSYRSCRHPPLSADGMQLHCEVQRLGQKPQSLQYWDDVEAHPVQKVLVQQTVFRPKTPPPLPARPTQAEPLALWAPSSMAAVQHQDAMVLKKTVGGFGLLFLLWAFQISQHSICFLGSCLNLLRLSRRHLLAL